MMPARLHRLMSTLAAGLLLAGVQAASAAESGLGLGLRQPLQPASESRIRLPSGDRDSASRLPERPRDERPAEPATSSTSIKFRGTQFVHSGGNWYRQRGDELVAIEAPAGVMVRELPGQHSLRWVAGVPYFYSNGLYYVWRERQRQYEVLQAPPAGSAPETAEDATPPRAERPKTRSP